MDFIIGLIVGLFFGGLFGFFIAALMLASHGSEDTSGVDDVLDELEKRTKENDK